MSRFRFILGDSGAHLRLGVEMAGQKRQNGAELLQNIGRFPLKLKSE